MGHLKLFLILAILSTASWAEALLVNGKGFQQRGFRFEQYGNVVDLVPMGNLPEVVVLGKKQILSIVLENTIRGQLANGFLTSGALRSVPSNFSGAVDLFLISQENGKKAKLVFSPITEKAQLPEGYVLRSESLGSVEVKNGVMQPFKDLGSGSFLYTFPSGQDGFKDVTQSFSLEGRVPQNMGSVKVEFRLRLTGNMTKPGWVIFRSKDEQEVVRLYVPEMARTGQVISIVREVPNLALDGNTLNVINSGVPMADFKFRILELKTTRNYSAR
jgi:hypothetical protein